MKCQDCGQEMTHMCGMVCVDICWPCEWRKSPGMRPAWKVKQDERATMAASEREL